MVDVLVVGGGPAGRAIAAACSDIGLRVNLLDPSPHRVWPHTLAAWFDELPSAVAGDCTAAVAERMRAVGTTVHRWDRPYAVLDNAALLRHLRRPDVVEVTGKAASFEHGPNGSTVRLGDDRRLAAAVVVDASGSARALSGGRPPRTPAQQTALGAIVPTAEAATVAAPGTGVFMDWTPAPDTHDEWPTFLYAVPLADDRTLLEETSLARRPGLPLTVLRRRLHARLGAAGITLPEAAAEERVRFPVDDPLPRPRRTAPFGLVPFGAAAGLVHPASGFSVASALRLAPWVASAIGAGLTVGHAAAANAAWSVLWPRNARTVNGLHRRGLEALLSMPPQRVPEFFELFFSAAEHHRRAFLSPESDFSSTSTAMSALFRRAPWNIRGHLARGGLSLRPAHAHHDLGGG